MIEEKEKLTLREANYQVECWENDLKRWLDEKEQLECLVDIKSINYDKIIVDGGTTEDTMLTYQVLKDIKQLDFNIQRIQDKIKFNVDWIDRQLNILEKYDKVEQLIVYYKEVDPKANNYTWQDIASLVHYSIRQCKRIYSRYKNKRNV